MKVGAKILDFSGTLLAGQAAADSYNAEATSYRSQIGYQKTMYAYQRALSNSMLSINLSKLNYERQAELDTLKRTGALMQGQGKTNIGKAGVVSSSGSPAQALQKITNDIYAQRARTEFIAGVERDILVYNKKAGDAVATVENYYKIKSLQDAARQAEDAADSAMTTSWIKGIGSLFG